jgi:hypothetical protein
MTTTTQSHSVWTDKGGHVKTHVPVVTSISLSSVAQTFPSRKWVLNGNT